MSKLIQYLTDAVEHKAADLFIVAGGPVSEKKDGKVYRVSEEKLLPPDTKELIEDLYAVSGRPIEKFLEYGDDDFSFAVPGLSRFRVNVYNQRNSMAAVVRIVAFDIPDYSKLHIPEEVMALSAVEHGMILFTGTAGSGKSTTQACIIDRINKTRDCHIITLEDPIEYLHKNDRSIVSQREISIDTTDYISALRACLRQSPDVILLGEMRDSETIHTAITAAETGHTVIATMHTNGAVNAIDRVIDSFAEAQQSQVRFQLATVLHTVVAQQMLPGINGGVVPAFEIMHINSAVRGMIRDNKNHQIDGAIAAGRAEGMISMDQSIISLYKNGAITKEVALGYSRNPEQLQRHL